MRITIDMDEELLNKAARLSGITDQAALVELGLKTLIEREAAHRLAAMGGTDPTATAGPRRRSDPEE